MICLSVFLFAKKKVLSKICVCISVNDLPDVAHGTTQRRLAFDVNVRPHLDPGFFLFNLGRSMQSQTAVVIEGFFFQR